MALAVDFVAQRIRITAPQTQLTIQELYDFCKDCEITDTGMAHNPICVAAGKDDLGSGVQVAVTMRLLENWQLEWWAGNYTATIGGGNIVAECGDPVAYVQGGPQVEITMSAAATIVSTGGDNGDGFTVADRTALLAIQTGVGMLLEEQLTEAQFKKLLFNRVNTIANGRITRYQAGDDTNVNVTYDANGIPTSEAIDE